MMVSWNDKKSTYCVGNCACRILEYPVMGAWLSGNICNPDFKPVEFDGFNPIEIDGFGKTFYFISWGSDAQWGLRPQPRGLAPGG
jgi:hypothetical protein